MANNPARAISCPLCLQNKTDILYSRDEPPVGTKNYYLCCECKLVFLDAVFHLDEAQAKARYDHHENSPDDPKYRKFLGRLATPLMARLAPGAEGLDYGCGPGPTISVMMKEAGFFMNEFDPVYFPNTAVLERTYDFMTCTEVIEHFTDPRKEFLRFKQWLNPKGILGVMTQILEGEEKFVGWWYHKDPTHNLFYQRRTLEWISDWMHWKIEILASNVIIWQL